MAIDLQTQLWCNYTIIQSTVHEYTFYNNAAPQEDRIATLENEPATGEIVFKIWVDKPISNLLQADRMVHNWRDALPADVVKMTGARGAILYTDSAMLALTSNFLRLFPVKFSQVRFFKITDRQQAFKWLSSK